VALDPPLPKWILCGTNGTLSSDGERSTLRYYDPKEAPPLEVRPGPAAQRRYGNSEVLPWKQETVPAVGRNVGTFYDNVAGVLSGAQAKWVTPQSVREVIRVIGLVRESHQRAVEARGC
jgi:predicted dehydrogenase